MTHRDEIGRYARQTSWKYLSIPALLVIALYTYHTLPAHAQKPQNDPQSTKCVQVGKDEYDCASVEMHALWKAYQDDLIKKQNEEIAKLKGLTFQAIRTRYSRADSCHNPRGNECLTAIGRDTKQGTTVACPRNIALGTRIVLSDELNHVYVCEDRYLEELDSQRGMPTIDVFAEASDLDKLPARKVVMVRILDK